MNVEEVEEAKPSPLDQYGDHAHQQKLTRKVMLKLDTRLVRSIDA